MIEFQNVLVVDDCETTRKVLRRGLMSAGYQVTTAPNGAEALKLIAECPPDYVVTDWRMPNVDGQLLCRCIRSADLEKYTYLILMTAHTEMMDLVDGLGAGADDYITKPVDMRELLARMQSGARILELDRRLTHVAGHDPLTGILNRRNLIGAMDRIIDLCRKRKRSVSAIMIDLDHFKDINDEYGHVMGDAVLVKVADLLLNQFRATDCVCRYGGEEFIIVLPECNEEGAFNCAERCREQIENATIDGEEPMRLGASIGVAELGQSESALQLIDDADNALLAAKKAGRNCVVKYSSLPPKSQASPVACLI